MVFLALLSVLIFLLQVFRGHDSILIICDRFLKILHFIVTTEKIMAEGLVRLFRDNVKVT